MGSFYQQFLRIDPNSVEHRLLVTLCLIVLSLLAVALLFALLSMLLRYRSYRYQRMWNGLHQVWDQEILEVLSGDLDPLEFRRLIEPRHELDFIRFVASYAYRLRGSDLSMLAGLTRPYLPHVAKLLDKGEAEERLWAVNLIRMLGMPEYEQVILERLEDEAPVVAMFAASTLLAQKQMSYITPVMDQLHRFDKWNLNSLAVKLAGTGPVVIPLMEKIYLDPARNIRTRLVAAEVLRLFNDYNIADAAAALLASDIHPDLAIGSLRLLADIGQQQHLAGVRQLCVNPLDIIRVNAMRTLRHLCIAEDRELFLHALDDTNPWVARHAARALLTLGDTASLEHLIATEHPRAMLARQVLAEHT